MVSVRIRPLLLALVAILAIALAAATLNTAVSHDGSLGTEGGGGFLGDGGPQAADDTESSSFGVFGLGGALPVVPLPCYPVLMDDWFLVGFGLVAATGLFLAYRRYGPLLAYGIVAGLGPPGLLIYALLTACQEARTARLSLLIANRTGNASGVFALTGGGGGGGPSAVSLPLVGVLALALVVAVALLVVSTGDDAPAPASAPAEPDPARMSAIGRAAGRAADRIEGDAAPDNAVYQAWKEMTDLLDVPNPAASTPAEFAAAAVDAGMDSEDVAELTALFEAVRYGAAEPTADREARAVDSLRRIEVAYAGEGP